MHLDVLGFSTVAPSENSQKSDHFFAANHNNQALHDRSQFCVIDQPVIRSTKFEFAINLKTAKGLGLDIPANLHITEVSG